MKRKNGTKNDLSRRDFIKTTAVGIGATALAGFGAPYVRARPRSDQWDADVLVLGSGLGGMTSTISAADAGAKVILIEKTDRIGGTAWLSGGSFSAANSRMQLQAGIQDSPWEHYRDSMRIGKYKANSELLKLYVENAGPTLDWLQDLGIQFTGPRFAPEHELYSIPRTCDAVDGGRGFIKVFQPEIDKRIQRADVQVFLETTVTELMRTLDGRVVGVKVVDKEGKERSVSAKAVMLATGGYASNRQMIKEYNPKCASILTVAALSSTGEVISMSEAIGAQLTHMQYMKPYFAGIENPENPGRPAAALSGILGPFVGEIWVNKLGRRFINEDTPSPDARETALEQQPDTMCFTIFDEKMKNENPVPVSGWTRDKFQEEAAKGVFVKKATTIVELAQKIEVDHMILNQTVANYNGYVFAGRDPEFERTYLRYMIENPPFYAIRAVGELYLTMGGTKTNVNLQVLDNNDEVIPGLYAVGEVMGCGQTMGDGLCGGMGNGPPIVFGRIAARVAAMERYRL